jgi:hypothetical protein
MPHNTAEVETAKISPFKRQACAQQKIHVVLVPRSFLMEHRIAFPGNNISTDAFLPVERRRQS